MALPIMVITYVSNSISTQSLLEQTKISDLQTIASLQSTTDHVLNAAESIGNMMANDPDVHAFLQEGKDFYDKSSSHADSLNFQKLVSSYLDYSDLVLSASLLTPTGRFIGETAFRQDQLSWYYNSSLLTLCAKKEGYWTTPYLALDEKGGTQHWIISHVIPLRENGVLLGFLSIHLLRSLFDEILSPIQDRVYIINDAEVFELGDPGVSDSYIIASKDQVFSYASFFYTSEINYTYLRNNHSIITQSKGDTITVTTQKYARMRWVYLIASPFDDIGQAVLTPLSQIFTLCLFCILFAVVAAFALSRIITRPIAALSHTIEKVADGDLFVRHRKFSNDEIGTLGTAFNNLLDRIQALMQSISQQQKNKRRLQIQLIQAQVKPHFLYNVLEMICSFIRDNLKVEALSSISHLAAFYRTSLSDGSDVISIRKERDLIENYLTLQHLRYIEFMDFTLSVNPCLFDYQIPKLTLQPIVENAIYHGLKQKGEKGTLCVVGYLQEDRIYFEIYDNGSGMSDAQIQDVFASMEEDQIKKDFGLASVMKRLNFQFNGDTTIDIKSKLGEYTNFTLSFPAIPLPPCS